MVLSALYQSSRPVRDCVRLGHKQAPTRRRPCLLHPPTRQSTNIGLCCHESLKQGIFEDACIHTQHIKALLMREGGCFIAISLHAVGKADRQVPIGRSKLGSPPSVNGASNGRDLQEVMFLPKRQMTQFYFSFLPTYLLFLLFPTSASPFVEDNPGDRHQSYPQHLNQYNETTSFPPSQNPPPFV